MLLTACTGTKIPSIKDIPNSAFSCDKWPDKPNDKAKERDAAIYLVKGHGAWRSCDQALSNLKKLKAGD